jgi:hypothetical protein
MRELALLLLAEALVGVVQCLFFFFFFFFERLGFTPDYFSQALGTSGEGRDFEVRRQQKSRCGISLSWRTGQLNESEQEIGRNIYINTKL